MHIEGEKSHPSRFKIFISLWKFMLFNMNFHIWYNAYQFPVENMLFQNRHPPPLLTPTWRTVYSGPSNTATGLCAVSSRTMDFAFGGSPRKNSTLPVCPQSSSIVAARMF